VGRQLAQLTGSFAMVAMLALIVGGLFLCYQYALILRDRKPAQSRSVLWRVTAAQHLGIAIWFGYAMALFNSCNDTSLLVAFVSVASAIGFPLLITSLSSLQARFCSAGLPASNHLSHSDRPKEAPHLTLGTYVLVGLGVLINYLILTSSGWEGLDKVILIIFGLSGVVLPLSTLSLFRREAGAPAVIPFLAIGFCLWGVIAGWVGIGTLFQG
jgi:hypothetical protein